MAVFAITAGRKPLKTRVLLEDHGRPGMAIELHSSRHMARDHRKLDAFKLADELALIVYRSTTGFPASERYGLQSQIRRAAVSTPTNIVEGCARESEADFRRFLDIAFGSSRELLYLVSVAARLGFLDENNADDLTRLGDRVAGALTNLRRALHS